MNTELNKQVSVWRGNNTPPTDYHLWIKENGDIYIKVDTEWAAISKILNIQDLTSLKKSVEDLLTLEIAEADDTEETNYKSYELLVAGQSKGVRIDIPRDRFVNDVKLGYSNATVDSNTGVIDIGTGNGDPLFLLYSILQASGNYTIIKIDLTKFITEKEYSDGLEVNDDNKLKVKIDPSSEFVSVSSNGIKVTGITDLVNKTKQDLQEAISSNTNDLVKAFTKITFSASPRIIENGVNTTIKLSINCTYNGTTVTPDTLLLNSSSGELSTDTSLNSYTDSINTNEKYELSIQYKGVKFKTESILITAVNALYYCASGDTFDSTKIAIAANKLALKEIPNSSYSGTFTKGQYLWLCVPLPMTITRVTSSGFDVPIDSPLVKLINNTKYNCYRSTSSFNAGTVNFTIYGSK